MIPYRTELRPLRRPTITIALIAANVLAWVLVQGAGAAPALAQSVCDLGLIPGELTGAVRPGTAFPMGDGYACVTEAGRHGAISGIMGAYLILYPRVRVYSLVPLGPFLTSQPTVETTGTRRRSRT